MILKQGTLIDASLIHIAARRPTMAEGQCNAVNPDATFGAKNERRRYTFGYNVHVAVGSARTGCGAFL